MIIWLASYPRSGNTLLRTLLNQCFGLQTYDDEVGPGRQGRVADIVGGVVSLDAEWDEFYPASTVSKDLRFVKTHRYPRDDQKAIYVYRDGRNALQSYHAFQQSFLDEQSRKSLLALVLGDDYYGDWSEHYRIWKNRSAPTLMVSYEELVVADYQTILRIGDFIELPMVNANWKNPMNDFRLKNPSFFRAGNIGWTATSDWTQEIDWIFHFLHGELMAEIGYSISSTMVGLTQECIEVIIDVLRINKKIAARCASLQFQCDERLRVIRQLSEKQ